MGQDIPVGRGLGAWLSVVEASGVDLGALSVRGRVSVGGCRAAGGAALTRPGWPGFQHRELWSSVPFAGRGGWSQCFQLRKVRGPADSPRAWWSRSQSRRPTSSDGAVPPAAERGGVVGGVARSARGRRLSPPGSASPGRSGPPGSGRSPSASQVGWAPAWTQRRRRARWGSTLWGGSAQDCEWTNASEVCF